MVKMKVLHLNTGNETGGGMFHILSLLSQLKEKEHVILGVFYDGVMAEKARHAGIEVVVFEQKSKFDLSIIKRLKKFIEENQIDILHSHGARANTISFLLKRRLQVPWFITVHSNPYDDFLHKGILGRMFSRINIETFKSADRILAVSNRMEKDLIRLGVEGNKISTILNGIDFHYKASKKYNREQFGLKDSDFVIMMIARLEPVKQHETALKALQNLIKKTKAFKLVLIGDGTRRTELQKTVGEMELEENVKFLLQREDVPELLQLADITILTSKSETFPLVLLESARAKKPVISTDVGGVQALIPNNEYGRIIQVGDASGLAEAICQLYLLKENGKLLEMGEKLYQHAKKNFSLESFTESVLNTYRNLNHLKNDGLHA